MPYLILSDLHSNKEALEAVLDDSQGLYDRTLCLGDVVGYGADPNYAVQWASTRTEAIIRGNHDKACVGLEALEMYNPAARLSAEWTSAELAPEHRTFLENLPRGPLRISGQPSVSVFGEFDLAHGSPVDEDQYLIHAGDVAPIRDYLDTRVTFFGHTHIQGGFLVTRSGVRRIFPNGTFELEPDHHYLVNPGSVGQPRDADPRAAYAIYTPEERTVEFRRVPYDVDRAAEKILNAGLPPSLAARLYEGM